MKKHFAKFIQVEGEIKEGDWFRITKISNDTLVKVGSVHQRELSDDKWKPNSLIEIEKVKLFLCCKDIQVGDKVNGCDIEGKVIENQEVNELLKDTKLPLFRMKNNQTAWQDNLFKVIGEISPDALSYVKEGDEFDEDEVGFVITDNKDWFFKEEVWSKKDSSTYVKSIKIKCSQCKHFH